MLDYLKKFNDLPQEIRNKFAAPAVLANVSEIEKRYSVSLATVIMRVLIKDIALVDLAKFLVFEFSLDARRAENLVDELNAKVFSEAAEYLGLNREPTEDILEKVDIVNDKAMDLAREKMAIRTSSFFFSPDDEKEIQELTKKVAEHKAAEKMQSARPVTPVPVVPAPQPIEKKMSDVMQKVDVNFSSDDLDNRFKNIVETYLRGVRNRIDIKQALIKDVNVGGLSLSEEAINEIIAKIDEVKKKYEEPKLVPPLPSASARLLQREGIKPEVGERDAAYDFSNLKKEQTDKQAATAKVDPIANIDKISLLEAAAMSKSPSANVVLGKVEGDQPLPRVKSTFKNFSFIEEPVIASGATPVSKPSQSIAPANLSIKDAAMDAKGDLLRGIGERAQQIDASKAKSVDIPVVKKAANAPSPAPVQPVMQVRVDNKKRMDDVKYVPKLVGPVEELRIMNLINFRRLSQDPVTAKEQIKEKINFLEEESYAKRLEGVKAWRQSPLNSLYIAIGQEAISKTGGIRAIINERQTTGQDYLTEAEFDAIMDLNKNLRF